MSNVRTAVEKAETPAKLSPAQHLTQLIDRQRDGIARALPTGMSPERFTRILITATKTTPALLKCDPMSFLGAAMLAAQLGLEPGPLGHAYLVPFGNQVQFIPGYKGLIDLARRSGHVTSIYAHAVREGDEFAYTLGLRQDLHHVPSADRSGTVTHVYAVAHLRDADPMFVVLTRDEVEAYRKRSRASSSGPWVSDWEAMALKTAVRRLVTWLPMSVQMATAVQSDAMTVDFTDLEEVTLDHDVIDAESEEVQP